MVRETLNRFLRSAVIWSFASAGLRVGAALLVLPLMVTRVSTEELGVWYLMMTLANCLFLLDCGFGPSLHRAVAYAWAGAKELVHFGVSESGDVHGRPNTALTVDIVSAMRRFYLGLALFLAVLLVIIFIFVLPHWATGVEDYGTIQGVFVVFGVAVFLNAMGSLWPGCLIGLNRVREANQLYVGAKLLNYVISALGLITGYGLWSLVVGYLFEGILLRVGGRWLFVRFSGLSHFGWGTLKIWKVLWPVAWRTGAVNGGAFLILQANLFIVGGRISLAEAASYGLTFQVVMMLAAVSQAWFQVKIPLIARWRVAGLLDEIRSLVITRIRLVMATYIVGGALLLGLAPMLLEMIGSKTHLLPAGQLAFFIWILGLEIHHAQFAALVLSSNQNPFLLPALISGFLIVLGSWWWAPGFGVWGVLAWTAVVQMAWNNWWTVWMGLRTIELSWRNYMIGLTNFRGGI
jgi:O-antigen/teichoic acid export membrane protein